MGHIPSAETVYAVAYLTNYARELLFDNNHRYAQIGNNTVDLFKIEHFSLGDPDENYQIFGNLSTGEVPDVSGKRDTCIKGAVRRSLDNQLIYGDEIPIPEVDTYTIEIKAPFVININDSSFSAAYPILPIT